MTREEWKERLPMIQAFVDGAEIEWFYEPDETWMSKPNLDFTGPVAEYRIAKKQKLRPWKPHEVPLGAWLRTDVFDFRCIIAFCTDTHFGQYQGSDIKATRAWSYEDGLKYLVHSTDNGKTWLPCGVME